jgi:hypothetical protein
MTRTLGGHRRFLRSAVFDLAASLDSRPPARPARSAYIVECSAAWGVNQREISRQPWHHRSLRRPSSERMRALGQRLLGLLVQFINRPLEAPRFLDEARSVGAHYGREARLSGFSMHDTVEAFLFFRRSFSQQGRPIPGLAEPRDLGEALAQAERIQLFMDTTLLGTISGYEQDPHRTAG